MRQYVAVQFSPGGRAYTYHNDGAPLSAGDHVKVELAGRAKSAVVSEVDVERPEFHTKQVISKKLDEEAS